VYCGFNDETNARNFPGLNFSREEMAQAAAFQAGAPILIVIPLAWLVIGWSLGQVLGRMSNLTSAIAARGVDSKEQIPVADAPSEVRPLIEAMNVLTARLQRALETQKRFVADAAHELRTPLAALRIQIDSLRLQPNELTSQELRFSGW